MGFPARFALALLLVAAPVAAQELSTHNTPQEEPLPVTTDAPSTASAAPATVGESAKPEAAAEPAAAAAATEPAKPEATPAAPASTVTAAETPKPEAGPAAIQPAPKPDKPEPRWKFITRPFRDKEITLLAAANAGAAAMDDTSSRLVIEEGGYERNPLMRPFVHNSGALAVESVTEVWLMAYLADWMKHSSHPFLRKAWWVPQVVNISAKVSGGIYNSVLLTH